MSKRRLYTLMKDRMYTNCNNTGDKYTKLKTEEKIPRHLLRSLAISDRMCYKQRDTAPPCSRRRKIIIKSFSAPLAIS